MTGHARVVLNKRNLWVRFESVGSRQKFNAVLGAFQCSFPTATWDPDLNSWQLPYEMLPKVVEFCNETFGVGSILFEQYTTVINVPRQLTLPAQKE